MKWQGRRGSDNIEDRRRSGGSGGMRLGGVGGLGLVAVVVIGWLLGFDVTPLLQGIETGPVVQSGASLSAQDRAMGDFVSVTLADTEEIWAEIFRTDLRRSYHPATLVLFSRVTPSPCGAASGATGPFYCPSDGKVYLDTDFFTTLSQDLGAGGDFAAAYVVAHEIGHHVQDELGILSKVNDMRARVSQAEGNALSVRVELQADCLAGLWARHAAADFGSIEAGDVAEAMTAAQKIGDDTLQRNAGRRPMPDSFTHGTSEQRQRWFAAGFDGGRLDACDTFAAKRL
jgi:predicted metalloprotease